MGRAVKEHSQSIHFLSHLIHLVRMFYKDRY